MGKPVIDDLRVQVSVQLPARVRWLVAETPWDWDFSRAREALKPISADDVSPHTSLSSDWSDLYIFGEEDFAQGGGASPFVTIQGQTGMVFGVDVERDGDATFLLNSSVPHFIETFRVFDEVLRTGTASPSGLLERVRAADPDAFQRSEWRDAAEHVRSSAVVGV
jgi:hypothetical protein